MEMTAPAPRTSPLALISMTLLLFVSVVVAHSIYVSLFASNYPFWDQWDQLRAELIPWWGGHSHFSLLFTPHNEHRIFFTRVWSMLLLWTNHGHWSNLVEAYANTLVWSGVLSVFFLFAAWDIKTFSMRIVLAACIICMGCLPFDWENTLVGFQSQFYFMVGAAILLTACAAYVSDTLLRQVLLLVLGVVSLFTMASGLLAPLAGVAVLGIRGLSARRWSAGTLLTAVGLFATALFGLIILPHVEGDISMQANGIVEHARGMLVVLMWPLERHHFATLAFIPLLWSPVLFGLARISFGRKRTGSELFLIGIAGWVLLQGFAIVHARGHDLTAIPSRYTDIVAMGVLANFTLAVLWASARDESRGLRNMSAAWLLLMLPLMTMVMIHRTPGDVSGMAGRGTYSEIEALNVSGFMATGDEDYLQHPGLEIPYPSATALKHYLLAPAMRSMISPASDASLTRLAEALRNRERLLAERLGVSHPPAQFQSLGSLLIMQGEAKAPATCTVDTLNGTKSEAIVVMRPSDLFSIGGWIVWPKGISSSDEAVLMLSDRVHYRVDLHMAANRSDVVKALNAAPSLTRGFSVTAPLGQVSPGTYTVTIAKATSADTTIYCNLPITVSVTR
jgi:hypothetical protein